MKDGSVPSTPLNVHDYERLAEATLEPGAWGYFAGGAGDEWTLRENIAAFERWVLRPRMLVDVQTCTTRTTVLGHEISMPLIVAPFAYQKMAHRDGELGTARAAAAAGTIMCLSTLSLTPLEEVAEVGGQRWFQLYVLKDQGATRELLARARDAGYTAVLLTVDAPLSGRRERDIRSGFSIAPEHPLVNLGREGIQPHQVFESITQSLTWRDLEWIAGESGLPVLVKGVLTHEDALLACEHGAAGVVVSNHGGRQLDGVAATLDTLPEVVEAVGGRGEVLVDGGIRRGTDVVKALALGARAVLAGRAVVWGLAVGGEEGARRVLELLREEIALALALLGCPSPADVTRAHVGRSL